MRFPPRLFNWLLLLCLIFLWGTSFMFTSLALRSFDPLSIVFFRVVIGALVLLLALAISRLRLPGNRQSWSIFLLLGLVGNLIPFFLIAWGQQTVDSSLAGMIMAVMPLITMLLAHYLVSGETLNRYKVAGFILGLAGVGLLLGPVFRGSLLEVLSALAILLAAGCYSVNTILVRRLPRFDPHIAATGTLVAASLVLLPYWLLQGGFTLQSADVTALSALIWLGVGPTGIASIILFAVIERAGPTFLSTINYLIPVVAFFSGAWILDEPVGLYSFVALSIILGGIALTRHRATHNARTRE